MDKINHTELQVRSTTCIFIAALGGNDTRSGIKPTLSITMNNTTTMMSLSLSIWVNEYKSHVTVVQS